MANLKKALGNTLDVVVATSDALCNTVTTIGKASTYASNYMDSLLKKQNITLAVDCEMFESTFVELKAQELAASRLAVTEWATRSPQTTKLYNEALAQLQAAVSKQKPQAAQATA